MWTNILDNAIDAIDGKGTITIATHLRADRVVVELTDSGPGIPAEVIAQIFDPFVTTKAPGEGTGLGLNISYSIVTQKHGGEIDVASEPGRTTFTISLPLAPSEGQNGELDRNEPDPGDQVQARSDSWRSR